MRMYEHDFVGWAEDTAHAIEEERWQDIDRIALADEVLSLSKSDKRAVISMFEVLLTHMLKRRYQPEKKSRSWDNTIDIQRKHIQRRFEESPSLGSQALEFFAEGYESARVYAANESGLDIETFPEVCEWTLSEVLAHA